MQLDLFTDDYLQIEIESNKTRIENLRRGVFSRLDAKDKLIMQLIDRIGSLESRLCFIESALGKSWPEDFFQ